MNVDDSSSTDRPSGRRKKFTSMKSPGSSYQVSETQLHLVDGGAYHPSKVQQRPAGIALFDQVGPPSNSSAHNVADIVFGNASAIVTETQLVF